LKFIVENSTLVDWSATFILRKGYAVQREDIEMNKIKKMLVENLVVSDWLDTKQNEGTKKVYLNAMVKFFEFSQLPSEDLKGNRGTVEVGTDGFCQAVFIIEGKMYKFYSMKGRGY